MAGAIMDVTTDRWGTPFDLFSLMEDIFGKFDLDAASDDNWCMCENHITKEQDALNADTAWFGKNIFINPPYGKYIPLFLNRSIIECFQNQKHITLLLPAKTETKWFQKLVWNFADSVIFIEGRVAFRNPESKKDNYATFSSIIVHFSPDFDGKIKFYQLRQKKEKNESKSLVKKN